MNRSDTDSLLHQPIAPATREEWTRLFAQPLADDPGKLEAVLVFRLGDEWLALAAGLFVAATEVAAAHRLPHRQSPVLQGIVNVRGQLYPSIALAALLGIGVAHASQSSHRRGFARQLLAGLGRQVYAFAVDEVLGLQRHPTKARQAPPTTVSGLLQPYLEAVLEIDGRQVGLLNSERLEHAMAQALL